MCEFFRYFLSGVKKLNDIFCSPLQFNVLLISNSVSIFRACEIVFKPVLKKEKKRGKEQRERTKQKI